MKVNINTNINISLPMRFQLQRYYNIINKNVQILNIIFLNLRKLTIESKRIFLRIATNT